MSSCVRRDTGSNRSNYWLKCVLTVIREVIRRSLRVIALSFLLSIWFPTFRISRRFRCKYEPSHDKTNIMACAPSENSDQPGHPSSLWSDWADVQADLSLRWAHRSFCWFCRAATQIYFPVKLTLMPSVPKFGTWQPVQTQIKRRLIRVYTVCFIVIYGPRQANLVLIAYASSEGSGEPAHPRSLARIFAARSYKQWVKRNLQTESQIPGPSEWLDMRS